jgi:hypothetical protein
MLIAKSLPTAAGLRCGSKYKSPTVGKKGFSRTGGAAFAGLPVRHVTVTPVVCSGQRLLANGKMNGRI